MSPSTPRNILVTGANGGIGRLTCAQLIADGVPHLVMAGRSETRLTTARDAVLAETGADSGRVATASGFDMLDPDAITAAVNALPSVPFDAVFLQAGGWVFADDYQVVERNGHTIEQTVFLNVFGAHATVRALLARGLLAPGCRVVMMGGEGARGIPGAINTPTVTDAADLRHTVSGGRAGQGSYTPIDALGYAKLMASLWAQQLAARHGDHLNVVCMSPGLTGGTSGTQGMPAWKEWAFQNIGFPLMVWTGRAQWPAAAARKCADCVLGRVGEHGDLLGAPAGLAVGELVDQKPMNPAFTDEALQLALWEMVEETVGAYTVASAA